MPLSSATLLTRHLKFRITRIGPEVFQDYCLTDLKETDYILLGAISIEFTRFMWYFILQNIAQRYDTTLPNDIEEYMSKRKDSSSVHIRRWDIVKIVGFPQLILGTAHCAPRSQQVYVAHIGINTPHPKMYTEQ